MPDTNKRDISTTPPPLAIVAPKAGPAQLRRLLDEWMQGDAAEQRETFAALKAGLDEDRPDGYKLFP